MEPVKISETPVNVYQPTRHNSPEYNHFHTDRHENLKSHLWRLELSLLFHKSRQQVSYIEWIPKRPQTARYSSNSVTS
jgi:hypothetical protein